MDDLRRVLQVITDECLVKDHAEEIEKLRQKFCHHITVIANPPNEYNFTCFEYALGIHDYQAYIDVKLDLWDRGIRDIFINSNFMKWLLDNRLLNIGNAIILYLKDNQPKHAGRIKADMVISKWGGGNIYQHSIYETPESYGNPRHYFSNVTKEQVFGHFKKWLDELEL